MRIVLSEHLKLRLKVRKIPKDLPEKIYREAEARYFDNQTLYKIAVLTAKYAGKERKMVTDKEIKNRLASGRWSYEKI